MLFQLTKARYFCADLKVVLLALNKFIPFCSFLTLRKIRKENNKVNF